MSKGLMGTQNAEKYNYCIIVIQKSINFVLCFFARLGSMDTDFQVV